MLTLILKKRKLMKVTQQMLCWMPTRWRTCLREEYCGSAKEGGWDGKMCIEQKF
jgi:hypothetical protein